MQKLGFLLGVQIMFLVFPAYAYIGPGMGAGAIAVVFGVIASILLAFVAILWYPVKRLFKGRKTPMNKFSTTDPTSNELDIDNDSLHHPDRVNSSDAAGGGHRGD